MNKKQGFTLIELLVVVLIIGILAAVALPQYQLAVDKAKYATVLPTLQAIKRQQELYYLTHGLYAGDWNDLDLSELPHCTSSLPTVAICNGHRVVLHAGPGSGYHLVGYEIKDIATIQQFFEHNEADGRSNWRRCGGGSERSQKLCRALGGTDSSTNANGSIFWRIP